MKQYDDIASTPLKWHRVYKYLIPLIAASALLNLGLMLKHGMMPAGILLIDYIYDVLIIVAGASSVYGFLYWKPIGWYGVMALQALQLIYNLLVLLVTMGSGRLGQSVYVRILFTSVIAVLVGIYYYKRKVLFFNTLVMKMPRRQKSVGSYSAEELSSGMPEDGISEDLKQTTKNE